MKTVGFAAYDPKKPLAPFTFERRGLRDNDVAMEILYCGVCHSDLHTARNDWGWSYYPIVPGHEIVGRVTSIGKGVTRYKPGDHVAVGCMVDSCQECDQCKKGEEQLCREGNTGTYAGYDRFTKEPTQGGYSKHLVVREEFCLRMPEGLDLSKAAPLLCAGITTWSPLKTWNVGPGSRVGVIGLGGLGHMAVKLAAAEKFDLIINTVSATHEIASHIQLLARDGTMIMLGLTTEGLPVFAMPLLWRRRSVAGSLIGGIRETQEMLDFCAEHGVATQIEVVTEPELNRAWDRMVAGDVKYRFVLDVASLSS